MKDCGVAVARLQGHSWGPTPLKGSRVNVGTTPLVPAHTVGKTCRRLMPAEWGGGPVVVRAREAVYMAKGSSVLTASMQNEEDAGEYRCFMAWPDRGGVTSTRNADEAEPSSTLTV